MIPTKLEYLFLLAVMTLAGWSLFERPIRALAGKRSFWTNLAVFTVACAAIDVAALNLGWWRFSHERIVGILIGPIPVEEFVLFALVFSVTIAIWESLTP